MSFETYVPDYVVDEWEEYEKKFILLVCSECGFIASGIVEHDCDGCLQDWWHLNVKGYKTRSKDSDEKGD